MELVNRINGIGEVMFTEGEKRSFKRIFEIAMSSDKRIPQLVRTEYEEEFLGLLRELFPKLEPYKTEIRGVDGNKDGYRCHIRRKDYESIGEVGEAIINTRAPLPKTENSEVILMQGKKSPNSYLSLRFKPGDDCVDDIVTIMGKNHLPCIVGARTTRSHEHSSFQFKGIAEVPYLGHIISLYQQAEEILNNIPEHFCVTREELAQIRDDSIRAENYVVRKESDLLYHATLAKLMLLPEM